MGRTEEGRIAVMESGSPLARHSINQLKIKLGDDGQRRLQGQRQLHIPDSPPPQQSEIDIYVPLSSGFIEQMRAFMIDTAQRRIGSEENLPIPKRIVGSAEDVYRIYKEAKNKKLQGQIVTPSAELALPVRPVKVSPANLFTSMFVARVKTLPWWRYSGEARQTIFTNLLPKACLTNLCSTDFKLTGEEALADRVQTYGYTLATIATAMHTFADPDRATDIFFPMFLAVSQKSFR